MKTEVHITVYTVVYSAVRNILYCGIEKVTREANEVETTFHQYVICFREATFPLFFSSFPLSFLMPSLFFTPSFSILVLVENLLIKIQLSQYQLTSVVRLSLFSFVIPFSRTHPTPLLNIAMRKIPSTIIFLLFLKLLF